MTPGSFDPVTCRALVGDERARTLEAKARADADSAELDAPENAYRPPETHDETYWGQVIGECALRTYMHAFYTRIERRRRKARASSMGV